MLSFYILFLIPSFLIHPHKLFSMQLGPGTASLACARLIVPFAPSTVSIFIYYPVVKWSRRMVWLGIMYSIANQWVQIMNYQLNILHWKRNVLEGSWTFRHIMTLTWYSNTPIINYTTITWSYPVNRLMDCQGCLDQNCIVPTNAWTGTIQFIIFFIFSSYIKDNRSEIKNLSCSHNFVSGWVRVPKNIRCRWHNNQLFLFVFHHMISELWWIDENWYQ